VLPRPTRHATARARGGRCWWRHQRVRASAWHASATRFDAEFVFDDNGAIVENPDVVGDGELWDKLGDMAAHDYWGNEMRVSSHKSYRPPHGLQFSSELVASGEEAGLLCLPRHQCVPPRRSDRIARRCSAPVPSCAAWGILGDARRRDGDRRVAGDGRTICRASGPTARL
jgi:hypothetical protein